MNTKVLTQEYLKKRIKCAMLKPLYDFVKVTNNKDGCRGSCKLCHSNYMQHYKRTKVGLIKLIYSHQKRNARKRNHKLPAYSSNDLFDWAINQSIFHDIYNEWVISEFNKWSTPSFDRLDDYKSYTLDNLNITTWLKNKLKYEEDARTGKNNKMAKSVHQFDLDGVFIKKFHSCHAVDRELGISYTLVAKCCRGENMTAGGFKWEYVNG